MDKSIEDQLEIENKYLRMLDFISDSRKICNRGSKSLKNYFQTGDTNYVKLYNLEDRSNPPNYIIELIEAFDEQDEEKEDKLIDDYIRHHIKIVIFFLVVVIISIVGWITCGVFCCCNCRCFPCCIKSKCVIPFFFISTIMNIIVIICCIIGFVKTKSIFKGISNGECSILNFINEGIEGESKLTLPKWGGIFNIIDTLNNTIKEISKIPDTSTEDNYDLSLYNETISKFKSVLINASNVIENEQNYKLNYSSKKYILDIAKEIGEYNYSSQEFTMGSYCFNWFERASGVGYGEDLYFSLKKILGGGTIDLIESAMSHIVTLYYNLQDMKDLIGDEVIKYADKIDKYGKIIFNLMFVSLLFFTLIVQLLLFIYVFMCRGNSFIKVFIHINWYILALLMVIIFLVGTFFALIGKLGDDILNMFNYIISKKNLESEIPLVFDDGTLLNECIHKNGSLVKVFELEIFFEILSSIKSYVTNIDDIIKDILLKKEDINYKSLVENLEERKTLKKLNFGFVEENVNDYTSSVNLTLDTCVSKLNEELLNCSIDERWSFSCHEEFPKLEEEICNITISDKCINPSTCINNKLSDKYNNIQCTKPKEVSNIIDAIFSSTKFAANKSELNSIYNQGEIISKEYTSFVDKNEKIMNHYSSLLSPLVVIFDVFVGDYPITEFLNCQFLGEDIRVTLYFLDNKVINDSKKLAVVVLICGLALGISIAFIIAIVIIINNENINLKKVGKKELPVNISNSQNDKSNVDIES